LELQAQLEQTVRRQQSQGQPARQALKGHKEFRAFKEYRAMLAQLEHKVLKEMLEQLAQRARLLQSKGQLAQRVQPARHQQFKGQQVLREQRVLMVCHRLIINIKQIQIKLQERRQAVMFFGITLRKFLQQALFLVI
jgi:hypothetical protein